ENSYVSGSNFNYNDFTFGIYLRTGTPLNNTPAAATGWGTSASSITTDNTNIYVAGSINDYSSGGTDGGHTYVQKYTQAGIRLWSAKLMGFDSTSNQAKARKIVYDRATGSVYVLGIATYAGSATFAMQLSRIDKNGNVMWTRGENLSNTRNEQMNDIVVSNGKIYITGYAYLNSSNDFMGLTEAWDVNGNKQWEYIYNKVGIIDECQNVVVDNAGHIFVGGRTNAPIFSSSNDVLLFKLNSAGNLLWQRTYNDAGNGDDVCVGMALSNAYSNNPRIYISANVQTATGQYYDVGTRNIAICRL
ncbi:MAG TPA: hypothetical protein VNY73_10800, partial [Bacteroidia bacterium]|nr:hypothetical protein [Bacteroidia bacterium]